MTFLAVLNPEDAVTISRILPLNETLFQPQFVLDHNRVELSAGGIQQVKNTCRWI
jgi:hypothetical protein